MYSVLGLNLSSSPNKIPCFAALSVKLASSNCRSYTETQVFFCKGCIWTKQVHMLLYKRESYTHLSLWRGCCWPSINLCTRPL